MPWSVQAEVVAQRVLVFGPSGSAVGIYVWPAGSKPAAGTEIITLTNQTADPYGGAVLEGVTSYLAGTASTYSQLISGDVNLAVSGMSGAAGLNMNGPASAQFQSGAQSGGDSVAALQLESSAASGLGTPLAILVAGQVQLDTSASQNIPQASAAFTNMAHDTNSGTTWVSGERAFLNAQFDVVNANFATITTALKAIGVWK